MWKKKNSRLAARALSADNQPVVSAENGSDNLRILNGVFSHENAARAFVPVEIPLASASAVAADGEIVNNNISIRSLPSRTIRSVSVDDPTHLQNNTRRRRRAAIRTVSADVIFEKNSDSESQPVIIRQPLVLLNRIPIAIEENSRPLEIDPQDSSIPLDSSNREDVVESSRTVEIESLTPRYEITPASVLLHRLTDDEINAFVRHSELQEQSNEIDSVGNGVALLVFTRYEFITGVRAANRLLFVHDIEQLYFFRHKNASGNIYHCRERSTCKAKVLIDQDGVCKQYGIESHTHPSIGDEYRHILFKHSLKEKCMNANVLHIERARNVFDTELVA